MALVNPEFPGPEEDPWGVCTPFHLLPPNILTLLWPCVLLLVSGNTIPIVTCRASGGWGDGVLPLLALCRSDVGCYGAPGSFSPGIEAAPGQVSRISVLRESGVFSCGQCAFKTWRRMGAPDWGEFQPVGSFEMEVTSSGLKKNCQAGPPGPG